MTLFSCVRKKDCKLVKTDKYIFSNETLEKLSVFMYGNMFAKRYMRFISYYKDGGEDFTFFGYNILTGVGKGYIQSNINRSVDVDNKHKFNIIVIFSEIRDCFDFHYFWYIVIHFNYDVYDIQRNVISNMLVRKKTYKPRTNSALDKSVFSVCISSFKSSYFFKDNLKDSDAKKYFKNMEAPTVNILKLVHKEIKKNNQDIIIKDVAGGDIEEVEVIFYYMNFYTPINRLVYFAYLINVNAFYKSSSSKTYSYMILSKLLDNKLEVSMSKITTDYSSKVVLSKEMIIDKSYIDFNTEEIYKSVRSLLTKGKIDMKINKY